MRRTSVFAERKPWRKAELISAAQIKQRGPRAACRVGSQNMNLMLGFDETAGLNLPAKESV